MCAGEIFTDVAVDASEFIQYRSYTSSHNVSLHPQLWLIPNSFVLITVGCSFILDPVLTVMWAIIRPFVLCTQKARSSHQTRLNIDPTRLRWSEGLCSRSNHGGIEQFSSPLVSTNYFGSRYSLNGEHKTVAALVERYSVKYGRKQSDETK